MKLKKFRESLIEFINKLSVSSFEYYYKKITKIYSGSEFTPPKMILNEYYKFIKNLKPLFNNNFLSVVLAPRECFKTTTFSVVLPYMLIINSIKQNDDLTTIVVGSYSQERVITAIYNPLRIILKERFEIITSTERHTIFKHNDKEFAIYPIHVNSTLRSCNWKGKRPQVIILDDIDYPAYVQGYKARKMSVDRFNGDFLPSIENGNSFILVAGNKEHTTSIISNLLDEEKDYVNKLVLPYKIGDKYIRPEWNEEWERKMRIQLNEDFDRLYNHILPAEKYEVDIEENPSGVKQVFLDFGTQEDSMVAVFFIGNTVVNIIKTDFVGLSRKIIPEINVFKPDYVFFEKNALQGEIFSQFLYPKLAYFNIQPFTTTSHKKDRIGLAIEAIENKEVKVIESYKEDLIEEINIYKEEGNSHVLDMIGVFCLFNKLRNPQGKIMYASKNN